MRTLRGRVALMSVLVVAIAFLLTGTVIVGATGRAEEQRLRDDLQDRLEQLELAGRGTRPGSFGPRPGGQSQNDQNQDGTFGALAELRITAERTLGRGYFLVVRQDDDVLATLGDAPANLPARVSDVGVSRFTDEGTTYLLRTQPEGPGGVTLQIGADASLLVDEAQESLRNRFLLVGTVATLLTGLATFVVTGLATRPLRQLREGTERVAATEDLRTRVTVDDAPTEVAAVAEGLNTMLARLERSRAGREAALHAARRFAADAGHELRTPLTAMQAALDTLVRNAGMPPEMREEVVLEIAEETRRLSTLLASLQTLARADAGLLGDVEPLDLRDVVDEAVDAARQRHPGVTVDAVLGDRPAAVRGARPWLRSIVDNLLRNAAIHGRPEGHITVRVALADDAVTLTVDDDGTGFPLEERDRAFERFTRGADATNRPGSGLGLPLVAQLTSLHGGTVSIGDAPTGGARVTVVLPPAG
ncbi:periplasmic sensor signal transduction histidine kinase [Euzebya pacifica]|uniref:histidine kinase n=1 Tax=Euzebya pacifica TaxID=1608957 RepID=A0A346XZ22_9ACTN|nr:HAMP domain-containing sensor histidine kinase [Euzebya pacifica]AXV07469.1 periplasmic sensor signal transduction histidine kinase [Euzebya pacifica]